MHLDFLAFGLASGNGTVCIIVGDTGGARGNETEAWPSGRIKGDAKVVDALFGDGDLSLMPLMRAGLQLLLPSTGLVLTAGISLCCGQLPMLPDDSLCITKSPE